MSTILALLLAAAVDFPRTYNAGVAAYRTNDFAAALAAFERATAAPDRALQQRAFYNLGNTAYRLGEADPSQVAQFWSRALKSYETALTLDPQDADAKFNHELVKKRLEELQKQQEQRQQQQNQHSQQDQQDQQNQESQQDQRHPPQTDNQPSPTPEQQPPPPSPAEQPSPQPPQHPSHNTPPPTQPENLDKQRAAALLDQLRENERHWNFFPEVQMKDLKDAGPPAKDW